MKRHLLIITLLFATHLGFTQEYTSADNTKAKDWGFNDLKPGDDYQLNLKKGQSDFVVRNFLQGYKYFIVIKAQDGVKDLDAWLINDGDQTEISNNTTSGNKTVYFKFTPNYTRKVRIKAKNYDAENPDGAYNVKIWVFYEKIN
jgi:hypothetical protein